MPMYQWPTKEVDENHTNILSTFGEFRGTGGDAGLAHLHSGLDLLHSGSAERIFSPDTGRVIRWGGAAQTGPIRVGRFGFNHVTEIFSIPGNTVGNVTLIDPVYVADGSSSFYTAKVAAPANDFHFERRAVPGANDDPFIAYRRRAANNYEETSFYPRIRAIGRGISSANDLHVIYYDNEEGPYADRAHFANPLKVFINYFNDEPPEADNLMLYTQADNQPVLDLSDTSTPNTGVVEPQHGGVNFKVKAGTDLRGYCGIYQLEYMICSDDILLEEIDPTSPPSNCTGRINMWRFDKLPPTEAQCFTHPVSGPLTGIVDPELSRFENVGNKFTVYVFTKSVNGRIRKENHWDIENRAKWPDGNYTVRVWVKNIRRARGPDQYPEVNERKYRARLRLTTSGTKIKVRRVSRFKRV